MTKLKTTKCKNKQWKRMLLAWRIAMFRSTKPLQNTVLTVCTT